jgi:hypothetical protein
LLLFRHNPHSHCSPGFICSLTVETGNVCTMHAYILSVMVIMIECRGLQLHLEGTVTADRQHICRCTKLLQLATTTLEGGWELVHYFGSLDVRKFSQLASYEPGGVSICTLFVLSGSSLTLLNFLSSYPALCVHMPVFVLKGSICCACILGWYSQGIFQSLYILIRVWIGTLTRSPHNLDTR